MKLRNEGKVPKELRTACKVESELILQMTDPDPKKRPSASDLLKSDTLKHWEIDVNYD
jgi:hypothetical protein